MQISLKSWTYSQLVNTVPYSGSQCLWGTKSVPGTVLCKGATVMRRALVCVSVEHRVGGVGGIEGRPRAPLDPDGPQGGNLRTGTLGLWECDDQGTRAWLTSLHPGPDTFWKNPQFLLSIWSPQEDRRFLMPCSVLVSLLQKPRHRHRNRKPHLAIGFYLFRVRACSLTGHLPPLGILPPRFLSSSPSVCLHTDLGADLDSVLWEYVT